MKIPQPGGSERVFCAHVIASALLSPFKRHAAHPKQDGDGTNKSMPGRRCFSRFVSYGFSAVPWSHMSEDDDRGTDDRGTVTTGAITQDLLNHWVVKPTNFDLRHSATKLQAALDTTRSCIELRAVRVTNTVASIIVTQSYRSHGVTLFTTAFTLVDMLLSKHGLSDELRTAVVSAKATMDKLQL